MDKRMNNLFSSRCHSVGLLLRGSSPKKQAGSLVIETVWISIGMVMSFTTSMLETPGQKDYCDFCLRRREGITY